MRSDILKALITAYGDLTRPSYAFARQRLDAGMHSGAILRVSQEFAVENQTSIGSDDVCVTLFVRPREAAGSWRWCVQLSLVGNYVVVSNLDQVNAAWPITEAREDASEAKLLDALRGAGLELLPYTALREATVLRPPNADAKEIYTVYNALFSDMAPFPDDASNGPLKCDG